MPIRLATPGDAAALLAIYARYIDTAITFEGALPTEAAFARRVEDIAKAYPYLVCEEAGRVIGYAYAHRQKERAAYQWNAELSVYLDPGHTAKGLGKRLYLLLMDILRLQGVRTVYGGVALPNPGSERLHEGLGFTRLGIYHNTGYKAGKWHDVAWFEKQIAPYDDPAPMAGIGSIPKEALEELLRRA